jgi:ABC-type nitrate/sulfonate/bicarbonate transport system substrate-binding protein
MRGAHRLWGSLLLALALGAGGCQTPARDTPAPVGPAAVPAPARPAAPEQARVQVVTGSLSANSLPLWLALRHGLFERQGLAVDSVRTESTAVATSLLAGESQIGLSSGVTAIQPTAGGTPLKLLAYFDKTNPYSVVVRPEIATAADLRGKTIALARPGDTAEIAARIALRPHGIVLGQDLYPLQIGNSPSRYAALLSGQVDAAMLSESFVDEAVAQGMRLLINLRQERLPFVNFGVIVTPAFAQSAPNTVLAFLRGMLEGAALFFDPANRAEAQALIAEYMKLDPADPVVAKEYEVSYENLARDPYPDREGVEAILAALTAIDPARYGALTPEAIIDASFMDALRAAGATERAARR